MSIESRARLRRNAIASAALAVTGALLASPSALAGAAADRVTDPFYKYNDPTPLAQLAPGTVIRKRTVPWHFGGIQLPYQATQILYRSTSVIGKPTVNVTSVIKPTNQSGPAKVVAYGSFYDSLDPRDQPSLAISGQSNNTLGGALANVESLLLLPMLDQGYTLAIADTEGQEAAFAAGPEYGINTLDGLRAASAVPETGVGSGSKIGLLGYSGGAIATEWAAELAPSYAPDINARLVGATMGGVLVNPDHNLRYIEGSLVWAGVMPMALVGISRAFEIDLSRYMNDYGRKLFVEKQYASITDALLQYPGLRFKDLTLPEYSRPEKILDYVTVANQLIMGDKHTPTVPLQMYQGANGESEGTSGKTRGIGPGDGVMVAADVRSLARKYCAKGVRIQHREFAEFGHVGAAGPWLEDSRAWLADRFAGKQAPENCGQIAPGNDLSPLPLPGTNPTPEPGPEPEPQPPAAPKAVSVPPELAALVKAGSPTGSPVTGTSDPVPGETKAAMARLVRANGRSATVSCSGPKGTVCIVRVSLTTRIGGKKRGFASRRGQVINAGSRRVIPLPNGDGISRALKARGSLRAQVRIIQLLDPKQRSAGTRSVRMLRR